MIRLGTVSEIFAATKSIISGDHFVYAKKADGWYHGSDYVNKDAIFPYVVETRELCRLLAREFLGDFVQTVVGPTQGGAILAQHTTDWLLKMGDAEASVKAVYADEEDVFAGEFASMKIGTKRVIKRGYDVHVRGARCLVVEDVINTGATVMKVISAIKELGGTVVGVAALCNRSGDKVTAQSLGVPRSFYLMNLTMPMYKEDDCPICKERGPQSVRTDLGKGKEFLQRKGLAA